LKPVIYQEGNKLLSQVFVGLAVRDFEDIVDEELYYYVETNLYPTVNKYMQQSYRRGVNKAVKEINRGKTSTLPVVTPYLTDLDQQAINLLIDNNVALVRNVGFDTRKIITHMIVDGVLKGKSVDVISREIKKNTLRLTRNRCRMIARTEIIRSYNQAAINKYKQSGIKMYQWITAFDERTCFPANTKIKTKNGYKRIQDVKVGDYVLTHKDRYKKVIKTLKRRYDGEFVRITLKGGQKNHLCLSATADHPLIVNGEWKKISEIQPNDKVMFLAKRCKQCNKLIPIYWNDLCKSCITSIRNKKYWSKSENKKRLIQRNIQQQLGKKLRKYFDEKMKDPEFRKKFGERVSHGLKQRNKNPEVRQKIVEHCRRIAQLPTNHFKNPIIHEQILKKAHKSLGKNHNGKTYIEKKVEWWLKKQKIKYIPQKYFNNGERRFWVDFYLPDYNCIIEADGKMFHDEEKDRQRDNELKKVFTGEILHWKEDDIRNNFEKCIQSLEQTIVKQNCFVEMEVKKIKKWRLKKPQTVYNLSVEDDNTYIANNIVVHNCDLCAGLDGKTFPVDGGERPPLHINCRCTVVPVIKKS